MTDQPDNANVMSSKFYFSTNLTNLSVSKDPPAQCFLIKMLEKQDLLHFLVLVLVFPNK